ncbi:hypothetical protein LIER_13577 [Lithospermum erythrorhizon]|uniref:Uncharacterized protein n=1 Tax=Lithospermum erythrorhizon TaxID=34254 RepID=A0AAV3PYE9_LITER
MRCSDQTSKVNELDQVGVVDTERKRRRENSLMTNQAWRLFQGVWHEDREICKAKAEHGNNLNVVKISTGQWFFGYVSLIVKLVTFNDVLGLVKNALKSGINFNGSSGMMNSGGGDSRNSRKNYARREVYASSSAPILVEAISFSDVELQGLELPHDDPVVIAPVIANYTVKRMLVDTGSSADILYLSTYDKLGLPRNML